MIGATGSGPLVRVALLGPVRAWRGELEVRQFPALDRCPASSPVREERTHS